MLNLTEAGVLDSRLVDAERAHDPQRRRALERADEAGVAIEEVGLIGPSRHLACVQEEAAGVRIRRTAEPDRDAENMTGEFGYLVTVLVSRCEMPGDIAVDVRLGHEAQRADLVAVGLEQHLVAEMTREPRQLGEEPRVAADQVVLQVGEE